MVKKKVSQTEKILNYMMKNTYITPMDALRECGCMRLAARIADIKELGYEIKTRMVVETNGTRYAEYRLEGV